MMMVELKNVVKDSLEDFYDLMYLDFVTKVDGSKKVRETKTDDRQKETKLSTRQAPRKRDEKFVEWKELE